MPEAYLGAIHDQPDFADVPELRFQPFPSDRCVPFPHSNGRIVQQPAQTPGAAQQFRWAGYLPRNSTQTHRPALKNPYHQPDEIANLGDALTGSQFPNPVNPCIIEVVDRHVTSPESLFCRRNNFTQVCPADQLFTF
jgi:hypothetical protein